MVACEILFVTMYHTQVITFGQLREWHMYAILLVF